MESTYELISEYTFLDETAWEYCENLGLKYAGTKHPSPEDWLKAIRSIESNMANYDHADKEEITLILHHVLRAERGLSAGMVLPGMTDTELAGVLASGKEETEKVYEALGHVYAPDRNLDIFLLLTNDLTITAPEKASERSKTAVRLAKIYFGEEHMYNDIMAAYGTCLIYMGKIKKATTVFDTIFEGDEMNLRSMIAICKALSQTDLRDVYKKYLEKAIETAMVLENDEIQAELTTIYTEDFPDADADQYNTDIYTMTEIMEMHSDEPEKLIWDNIQEMHPREMEMMILDEEEQEILDKAYKHLQDHAAICLRILQKEAAVMSRYNRLSEEGLPEHKIQQLLIDEFINKN